MPRWIEHTYPRPIRPQSCLNQPEGLPKYTNAVCDDNLRFLDVFAGWPGSVHDAHVFLNSPLYQLLEDENIHEEQHLLGNSAYPLTPYMMIPFRDNGHLTD